MKYIYKGSVDKFVEGIRSWICLESCGENQLSRVGFRHWIRSQLNVFVENSSLLSFENYDQNDGSDCVTFQARSARRLKDARDSNLLLNPNPKIVNNWKPSCGVEQLFFVSTCELPNPWQKQWWQRWLHCYRMIWMNPPQEKCYMYSHAGRQSLGISRWLVDSPEESRRCQLWGMPFTVLEQWLVNREFSSPYTMKRSLQTSHSFLISLGLSK